MASGPNSGAQMLAVPATDITPGASPRKKPRKQQHVISTEESEMMETNSTDEEKFPPEPLSQRAEKRKSPPKEYIGKLHYYEAVSSRLLENPERSLTMWLYNLTVFTL